MLHTAPDLSSGSEKWHHLRDPECLISRKDVGDPIRDRGTSPARPSRKLELEQALAGKLRGLTSCFRRSRDVDMS